MANFRDYGSILWKILFLKIWMPIWACLLFCLLALNSPAFGSASENTSQPVASGISEDKISDNRVSADFGISKKELRDLVAALAPRVNLFNEIWTIDPQAEIYAGAARDFVYWILGHFGSLRKLSPGERRRAALKIREELLSLNIIESRKILSAESDCDIISDSSELISKINSADFNLRKIDRIDRARLDATTEMGRSEIDQGYIPAEKMRLSKSGIVETTTFGDPLTEILEGRLSLTVPNPDRYDQTHFVKLGLNHQALLALRYLRLLAQDYGRRFGADGYPNINLILDRQDCKLMEWIRDTIKQAIGDPKFESLLNQHQGEKWIAASIMRAFRNLNPTATFNLLHHFGVDALQAAYPDQIPSLHQFLISPKRDEEKIRNNWRKYFPEGKPEDVFLTVQEVFPDSFLYHGAGSDLAFRSLIYQGILPSNGGLFGSGFYGVSDRNLEKAEAFSGSKSGNKDLIVKVPVLSTARIFSIESKRGDEIFKNWQKQNPKKSYDEFAEDLGIDILFKSKGDEEMVVKNRQILGRPEGFRISVLGIDDILLKARSLQSLSDLSLLIQTMKISRLVPSEIARVIAVIDLGFVGKIIDEIEVDHKNSRDGFVALHFISKYFSSQKPLVTELWISEIGRLKVTAESKEDSMSRSRDFIFLDSDEFRELFQNLSEEQIVHLAKNGRAMKYLLLLMKEILRSISGVELRGLAIKITDIHAEGNNSRPYFNWGNLLSKLSKYSPEIVPTMGAYLADFGPVIIFLFLFDKRDFRSAEELFEKIVVESLSVSSERLGGRWEEFLPFIGAQAIDDYWGANLTRWKASTLKLVSKWFHQIPQTSIVSHLGKRNAQEAVDDTEKIMRWTMRAMLQILSGERWSKDFVQEILTLYFRLKDIESKISFLDLQRKVFRVFESQLQRQPLDTFLLQSMLKLWRFRRFCEFGKDLVGENGTDWLDAHEQYFLGTHLLEGVILESGGFASRLTPEMKDIFLRYVRENPLGDYASRIVVFTLETIAKEIRVKNRKELIAFSRALLKEFLTAKLIKDSASHFIVEPREKKMVENLFWVIRYRRINEEEGWVGLKRWEDKIPLPFLSFLEAAGGETLRASRIIELAKDYLNRQANLNSELSEGSHVTASPEDGQCRSLLERLGGWVQKLRGKRSNK